MLLLFQDFDPTKRLIFMLKEKYSKYHSPSVPKFANPHFHKKQ
jgi:hypothetical protein